MTGLVPVIHVGARSALRRFAAPVPPGPIALLPDANSLDLDVDSRDKPGHYGEGAAFDPQLASYEKNRRIFRGTARRKTGLRRKRPSEMDMRIQHDAKRSMNSDYPKCFSVGNVSLGNRPAELRVSLGPAPARSSAAPERFTAAHFGPRLQAPPRGARSSFIARGRPKAGGTDNARVPPRHPRPIGLCMRRTARSAPAPTSAAPRRFLAFHLSELAEGRRGTRDDGK
jgi:hypothetical protein